jgi:hypothetical protein
MAYFQGGSLGVILFMFNNHRKCPKNKFLVKHRLQTGWLYDVGNSEGKKPYGGKQDEFCCKEVCRQIPRERINV